MKKILALAVLAGCSSRLDLATPPVDQLPVRTGLPDPLVLRDGRKVGSLDQWISERRPQLEWLFQYYMYGVIDLPSEVARGKVTRTDENALGGKAVLREVTVTFGKDAPPIHLLLVVPKKQSGPAPAFLGLSFTGNHSVLDDPKIALPTAWMRPGPGVVNNRATDESRGKAVSTWAIEQSIDRGYAVATFYYGDIFPDKPDFSEGLYRLFYEPKEGQKSPGDLAWGAIAMWAFGLHRAVDYLLSVPEIDPGRIAVFGHSRNGKAALVAAAFDERIALAVPHQAGCGGTAPSRTKNPKAESVKRINTSFPHWFNDTFKKFNDQVDRLPFDQNCLLALCAPRPILYTNALDDQWADPGGQFEMMRSAGTVYRLYGVEGVGAEQPPETGKLLDSRLGYFIREGKHSTTPGDWKVFLDFADRHLPAKK